MKAQKNSMLSESEYTHIKGMTDKGAKLSDIKYFSGRSSTTIGYIRQSKNFADYRLISNKVYLKRKGTLVPNALITDKMINPIEVPKPTEPASVTHKILMDILEEIKTTNTLLREAGKSKGFISFLKR